MGNRDLNSQDIYLGFLNRLARDRSGNTLALIAAAILPLLGLVGGGIDMGRAYLASSRLQQACDAGVLAARKKLGTEAAVTGSIPSSVAQIGYRFFNVNFREGTYGSESRDFVMTLENDYAISGKAKVDVPTSIMTIFGFEKVPISVDCQSTISVSGLDVMMVLDVTGSMRHTNAGDTLSRIDSLKQVIRNFHAQLEGAKAPGSEIRYGFVPYATNVNVGHVLQDDWVVDNWTYQSRRDTGVTLPSFGTSTTRNWQYVSGTRTPWTTTATYPATYVTPGGSDQSGYYTCSNALPQNSWTYEDVVIDTDVQLQADPPAIITIKTTRRTHNGTRYRHIVSGTECQVQESTDTNYVQTFEHVTSLPALDRKIWSYEPVSQDVSNWRTETDGCIEERKTTKITDFNNVDLAQNLDLDIDLVPSAGDPDTQWRPRYPDAIYARSFDQYGSGSFTTSAVRTDEEFANTGTWWFSDCPAKAQKLAPMTTDELDTYLATLTPYGATYHDIGMIWGARLLSPTGLFASENEGDPEKSTGRHLIFLTDGQTEPYDLAYGTYGIEGLDQRRWDPSSSMSLAQTVEGRFGVACEEAKKRNLTVWVIAFGTFLNQAMLDCAGDGQYFEASSADDLNNAFASIAKSIGDLRLSE